MSASDLLQHAAANGISYVQFGDNLPLEKLSHAEREQLQALAARLNVNIEVGTRRLTQEQILLCLPIAQQFSSRFLRVVIDDQDYHPTEAEVIGVIHELLPKLKKAGVMLAIENHDRFPAKTLERIIQKTDRDWVGICLDTANSLGAGEGHQAVLETLAPYTINLHVKDITITRLPHKMGFIVEGCAAGQGLLPIPVVLATLEKYGRCQTATLEVWSQPAETVEVSIANELRWVDQSIQYLKKLLP